MTDAERAGFQAAKADVQFLRWIFGWNLVVGWGMVTFLVGGVGYFLGFPYLFGLVGFVAGLPMWYQGTGYINRHYEGLRDAYLSDVETYAPTVLQAAGAPESAEYVTLTSWSEDRPMLVESPTAFGAVVLAIGADALWIYDETSLDLQFLSASLGTDTDEVERIDATALESVTYEDRILTLETTDGTEYPIPCAEEPVDAIASLRALMYAAAGEEADTESDDPSATDTGDQASEN
jgi:hypothetical protein